MTESTVLTDADLAEVIGGGANPISKLQSGGTADERVYNAIGMCGCRGYGHG